MADGDYERTDTRNAEIMRFRRIIAAVHSSNGSSQERHPSKPRAIDTPLATEHFHDNG